MSAGRPTELERLSVVIVVGDRRDRLRGCLEGLLEQSDEAELEILVQDLGSPSAPPVPFAGHPAVRVTELGSATSFAAARTAGIRTARGDVVAFVEEHVQVCPGWARALLEAHGRGWDGVGPRVENGNPGLGRADLTGIMSYGRFAHQVREEETQLIPGQNSSYRREVLLALGDDLERLLASDNALIQRLVADGHRLAIVPTARIRHLNEGTLGSVVRGYFLYHRLYGHLRAAERSWPWWRRLAYVVLTPVIPLYYLAHTQAFLARHNPPLRRTLLRGAHLVYLAQLAGATGQAVGLLLGPGNAEAAFTRYECTEERPLPAAESAGHAA